MIVLQKLVRYNTKNNYCLKIINKNQIGYHGVIEDYLILDTIPIYRYKCYYNGRLIAKFESFIDEESLDNIQYINFVVYNDPIYKGTAMHRYHNQYYKFYNGYKQTYYASSYHTSEWDSNKIRSGLLKYRSNVAWTITKRLRQHLERRLNLNQNIHMLYLNYAWRTPLGDRILANKALDLIL
jgi:hypothetical protein